MSAERVPEELDHWRDLAACKGRTRLFFPVERESSMQRAGREAKAKQLCAQCPVRIECRDWARQNREPFVAGGENGIERARAGFEPLANGEHFSRDALVDPDRARRLQAEQELAAIYLRDVPLEHLEQVAAFAKKLDIDHPGDPR